MNGLLPTIFLTLKRGSLILPIGQIISAAASLL